MVKRFGARTVVVKTFVHYSKALKRTLSIYGHVREQGLETQLALPKLLSVDRVGDDILLTMEYMGPDYNSHVPVTLSKFKELCDVTRKELSNAGVGDRMSHDKANWCIVTQGCNHRAYLVDVGRCVLSAKALGMTKERREVVAFD